MRTGATWHSPYNVYRHLDKLAKKVGLSAINNDGKYKVMREARIAAVTALVIYKMTNKPAYIQLPPSDPPDAYIMQESLVKKGQLDISTIEITSYRGQKESLLDQLIRTKVSEVPKYSDEYILVVELLSKKGIDYDAIREYLNSKKIQFPIWTLFGKTVDGSTTAELTIINPETASYEINIGKLAFELKEKGMKDVLSVKRTGSEKNVRTEPSGENHSSPWDHLLKSFPKVAI